MNADLAAALENLKAAHPVDMAGAEELCVTRSGHFEVRFGTDWFLLCMHRHKYRVRLQDVKRANGRKVHGLLHVAIQVPLAVPVTANGSTIILSGENARTYERTLVALVPFGGPDAHMPNADDDAPITVGGLYRERLR